MPGKGRAHAQVYFPHLYPPLLRTLLEVTEPETLPTTEVFGPEIILACESADGAGQASEAGLWATWNCQRPS